MKDQISIMNSSNTDISRITEWVIKLEPSKLNQLYTLLKILDTLLQIIN